MNKEYRQCTASEGLDFLSVPVFRCMGKGGKYALGHEDPAAGMLLGQCSLFLVWNNVIV